MPGRRIPRRPDYVADVEYARRTWRGGVDGSKTVPGPVAPEAQVRVEGVPPAHVDFRCVLDLLDSGLYWYNGYEFAQVAVDDSTVVMLCSGEGFDVDDEPSWRNYTKVWVYVVDASGPRPEIVGSGSVQVANPDSDACGDEIRGLTRVSPGTLVGQCLNEGNESAVFHWVYITLDGSNPSVTLIEDSTGLDHYGDASHPKSNAQGYVARYSFKYSRMEVWRFDGGSAVLVSVNADAPLAGPVHEASNSFTWDTDSTIVMFCADWDDGNVYTVRWSFDGSDLTYLGRTDDPTTNFAVYASDDARSAQSPTSVLPNGDVLQIWDGWANGTYMTTWNPTDGFTLYPDPVDPNIAIPGVGPWDYWIKTAAADADGYVLVGAWNSRGAEDPPLEHSLALWYEGSIVYGPVDLEPTVPAYGWYCNLCVSNVGPGRWLLTMWGSFESADDPDVMPDGTDIGHNARIVEFDGSSLNFIDSYTLDNAC